MIFKFLLIFFISIIKISFAQEQISDEKLYRILSQKIRPSSTFIIPIPSQNNNEFSYEFLVDYALWENPKVYAFPLEIGSDKFYKHFWDKLFLKDGSYLQMGEEQVPLTCIYVAGQDNRYSKDTPLIPDFILKVYLVANDYSCNGPINPNWPNSGNREMWDTYLYFEIKDPTIMLPVNIKIRHRWLELPAVLVDRGISK